MEIHAAVLFPSLFYLALILVRAKGHFYPLKYKIFMKTANPKL